MVVRLFPHYDVEKVWQYAERNFMNSGNGGATPLFMSEQDYQNHVSLICEVHDADEFADFYLNKIASCADIAGTRTVTLMKPAFFSVPEDAPNTLCRFLLPLKIYPNKIPGIYNKILGLEPPKGIHFAYTALSLGEEDIIVSLLASDRKELINFVSGRIEDMGIESLRIGVTHRTKQLVDPGKWVDFQKKYRRSRLPNAKGGPEDFAFDWTHLTRCCVHGQVQD